MKKYLVVLMVIVSVNASSAVIERPSKNYPDQALKTYSWLSKYKKASFEVSVSDDAKRFMDSDSLQRYFKLKMRNFVKDIELLDSPKGLDHNYCYLKVELYKYNDATGIHYGLISLKLDSAISFSGNEERIYELTTSIAGSESQLTGFIKQEIDKMVEVYAEDYLNRH